MVATDPEVVIKFCGAILEGIIGGELSWEGVGNGEALKRVEVKGWLICPASYFLDEGIL